MRYLMMCCAGIVAVLWGGAATAQTGEPDAQTMTETRVGTVLSVSETSVIITADDGRRIAFTRDSRSAVPADLAPGQRVKVEYHVVEGGAFHVMNVTMQPPVTTGAASEDMPMTASPFPLLGLLGVVALAAGLSARAVAVRKAR